MAPLPESKDAANKILSMRKRDDEQEENQSPWTELFLTGGSRLAKAADLDQSLSFGGPQHVYPSIGAPTQTYPGLGEPLQMYPSVSTTPQTNRSVGAFEAGVEGCRTTPSADKGIQLMQSLPHAMEPPGSLKPQPPDRPELIRRSSSKFSEEIANRCMETLPNGVSTKTFFHHNLNNHRSSQAQPGDNFNGQSDWLGQMSPDNDSVLDLADTGSDLRSNPNGTGVQTKERLCLSAESDAIENPVNVSTSRRTQDVSNEGSGNSNNLGTLDLSRQCTDQRHNRSEKAMRGNEDSADVLDLSRQQTDKLNNRRHRAQMELKPDIGSNERRKETQHMREHGSPQPTSILRRRPSDHVLVQHHVSNDSEDDLSMGSISTLGMGDFGMGGDSCQTADVREGTNSKSHYERFAGMAACAERGEKQVEMKRECHKEVTKFAPNNPSIAKTSFQESYESFNSEDMESIIKTARQIGGDDCVKEHSIGGKDNLDTESLKSPRKELADDSGSFPNTDSFFISRGVASRRTILARKSPACKAPETSTKMNFDGSEGSGTEPDDILSEAQNYLVMSMLVYIYAQLREMAVLGFTDTDFRAIDVNSYRPWSPNTRKDSFASLDHGFEGKDVNVGRRNPRRGAMNHLKSSHVHRRMSMTSDLGSVDSLDESFDSNMSQHSLLSSSISLDTYAYPKYLLNTKSAGFIIRVVLSEFEQEKISHRGSNDDEYGFKLEHDTSIMKEFQHWIDGSKAEGLDSAVEEAIKQVRDKIKLSHRPEDHKMQTQSTLRQSITKRRQALEKTESLNGNWYKLQRRLVEDHFRPEGAVTEAIIDEVMDKTSYFNEGSVLNHMAQSGIEVAWFGDRHPNEAIYCICINREIKNVTVVFRGTANVHNWQNNLKVGMLPQKNPVATENYQGRKDFVKLHTGFGIYLLKRRKDDRRRKIDEIFKKIEAIGQELAPDGGFRVSCAGHSLGGALATIFSFYAAAEKKFTKVAPIRVFTFAAPRVGDQSFADAYQHLESTGRVLHGRFANCRDIVPLLPNFAFDGLKHFGPWYQHVGLQVRLHELNLIGKYRVDNGLDLTYASRNCWWSMFEMAWKNNFISNINTLQGFGEAHSLSTHFNRLDFARKSRLQLERLGSSMKDNREWLKTLDDYYIMRHNLPHSISSLVENMKRRLWCSKNYAIIVCSILLTSYFVSRHKIFSPHKHEKNDFNLTVTSLVASNQTGWKDEFGVKHNENAMTAEKMLVGASLWGSGISPAFFLTKDGSERVGEDLLLSGSAAQLALTNHQKVSSELFFKSL